MNKFIFTFFRECIRLEGWSERVELRRVSDHFIFSVESSGCIPPEVIVREVRTLQQPSCNELLCDMLYSILSVVLFYICTLDLGLFKLF